MDGPISRAEHEEFCKRMDDEHNRINHRINELKETVREIGALTASVQKLALSVENMARTQSKQGERLEELEGRDGEMWRKVTAYILTTVIGIVLGYMFTVIGL